jgi:acetolactate synthase-1/3 small subunit
MKKNHTISIFTENEVGLLHRVIIIFTRRHINIESLNASASETKGVHRFTIVVHEEEEQVRKVVKQIEKQVEVIKAFYHTDEETVFQEVALYKLPIEALQRGFDIELVVRENNARLLTMDPSFIIIEKTGHKDETQALFEVLRPFGLLEFVRSGRVSLTRGTENVSQYLKELELAHSCA